MKFIKLTKWNGGPVYVNAGKIETIVPDDYGAMIELDNARIDVNESAGDIIALCEEG